MSEQEVESGDNQIDSFLIHQKVKKELIKNTIVPLAVSRITNYCCGSSSCLMTSLLVRKASCLWSKGQHIPGSSAHRPDRHRSLFELDQWD